jgi:hypothetical protein
MARVTQKVTQNFGQQVKVVFLKYILYIQVFWIVSLGPLVNSYPMFRGKVVPSSSGSNSPRRLNAAFPIKLQSAAFGILAGVLLKNLCILGVTSW